VSFVTEIVVDNLFDIDIDLVVARTKQSAHKFHLVVTLSIANSFYIA
jgi:hypothetical protein